MTTSRPDRGAACRPREGQPTTSAHACCAAIEALEAAGAPITAAAVATAAGVSTWLVYADGLENHLDAARQRQAARPPSPPRTTRAQVTPDSVHTDLAIARAEIRRLRAEHDKLRSRLRLQLGAEIEGPRPGRADRRASPPSTTSTGDSSPNETLAPPNSASPTDASANSKTTSPPPATASGSSSRTRTGEIHGALARHYPRRHGPRRPGASTPKTAPDQAL